jgi:hypothetical protein
MVMRLLPFYWRFGNASGLITSVAMMVSISASAGENVRSHNIILILADDLGYADLSCYMHVRGVSTPNLGNLAASRVRMTQAYA